MRRTTATTDYLKECMGTALLELMKEKPIEKISIVWAYECVGITRL